MLYALPAVVTILLVLYLMPVKITVAVKKDNENDNITLGLVTFFGLLKLKTEIPLFEIIFENGKPVLKYRAKITDRKRSKLYARFAKLFSIAEGEGLYKIYKSKRDAITLLLKYVLSKTRVYDICLRLSIGTGDAAMTGLLYGTAWIVIGSVIAISSGFINIDRPKIAVVPVFGSIRLCADFSCIISIGLGHIINAGIRAIPALLSVFRKKI